MARQRNMSREELELLIRRLLAEKPDMTTRQIMAAGARASREDVLRMVREIKAGVDVTRNDPPPIEPPPNPFAPATELIMPPSHAALDLSASPGWQRFQRLLSDAQNCTADSEYQRSLEAMVALRNLLTSLHPITMPGKGIIPRAMADGERAQLLTRVIRGIAELESSRADVDAKGGRWFQAVVDAMARSVAALMLEGKMSREAADKLPSRFRAELMSVR